MQFSRFFVAAFLLLLPSFALAEDVTIKAPTGDESIVVSIPKGWHRISSADTTAGQYTYTTHIFVPMGQTKENWDSKIEVSATTYFKPPRPESNLKQAINLIEFTYVDVCKSKRPPDAVPHAADPMNHFSVALYKMECVRQSGGKSLFRPDLYLRKLESQSGAFIQGENTVFEVHYSRHSDVLDKDEKGNFTGPAAEIAAYKKSEVKADKFISGQIWPCDPTQPDRPCNRN